MQTTVETESPTKRKLSVDVPAEEVAPLYEAALKRLSRQVKIPGFRPGKAPKNVLESRIGKDTIKEEVLRDALPSFYARAATEQSLDPLTHPEIEVTHFEEGEPLSFVATVEVRPEFRLPEYKDLEVTRPAWAATEEEIETQLERLRDQFATVEDVSRNARTGDYVVIDVFATRHGQKIEELTASDMMYEVGSGSFVPQLDQELEGKRTGDIIKFTAPLPGQPADPPAGRQASPLEVPGAAAAPAASSLELPGGSRPDEATFQVVVKQVQAKKLPPADDEFAVLASEFDTLEDLKLELRRRIESIKKAQADMELHNRIMEDLVDAAEVPIPESLLQSETQARLSRLIRELERAGITLEQYLQVNESTEEELVKGAREAAEKTVAADLILEAIARAEDISVENRDIAIEVAALSRQTGREAEQIMEELKESGRANLLAGDILRRKALNFLVEQAKIDEEDPGLAEPESSLEPDQQAEGESPQEEVEAPEKAPEQE